jgi:hypothetical protein
VVGNWVKSNDGRGGRRRRWKEKEEDEEARKRAYIMLKVSLRTSLLLEFKVEVCL